MLEPVFSVKCRIVAWVDADTLEAHPLICPPGINLRIRLKDRWEVERDEDGHDIALEKAKEALGDAPRDYIRITNDAHRFTFGRLEARVDRA